MEKFASRDLCNIMATKTGFTMDFTSFNKGFKLIIEKTVPGLAMEGLLQAGALLIRDGILEEPKAPHLTGHLWRSQKIEKMEAEGKLIGVQVGFDVPYAARLHEAPNNWNWTLDGSGPKFLEAKMATNPDKYIKPAAEHIKKGQKPIGNISKA